MKKYILEEKGSMAVYVSVVLLSFLIVLTGVYMSSISVRKGQLQTVLKIKQSYELGNKSIESIYKEQYNKKYVAGTIITKPNTWTSTQVTPISDGNGGTVPLPNGFYYVGGNIDTGLIISDNVADANKGESYEVASTLVGNQFVWIPVANETALTRTLFDDNGQPTTGLSTNYTEPMNYTSGSTTYTGYSTEASEYNTMKTQVLLYGGFYIGRYEAGVDTTTLRTTYSTAQTVVCKKGVAPYNYVPWGKSMDDASEMSGKSGAVYLSKKIATQEKYVSVISTLTYSCQWDAMCRYIGDANRTTPTKSAAELTGNVETDMSKNIYDLAGNCREWTMEAYSDYARVLRAACFSTNRNISFHGYQKLASTTYEEQSFRISLYIK